MSDCNVNEIMAAAGCYACLTPEQLEVIQTELLCRIYTNGGGGGGTPGGLDQQVQFNDGGTFGGDAGLTYNKTTNLLTAGDLAVSSLTAGSVLFAGAAGAISQDNANLFWDDTLNKMSIGDRSSYFLNISSANLVLKNIITSAGDSVFGSFSEVYVRAPVNIYAIGSLSAIELDNVAASALSTYGFYGSATVSAGSSTECIGMSFVSVQSGGTVSSLIGVSGRATHTGGTLTDSIGLSVTSSGSGTCTNEYGIKILTKTGGTVTNRYGIHLQCRNPATVGHLIKLAAVPTGDAFRVTSSADAVLMRIDAGGKIGVGATTPTYPVDITLTVDGGSVNTAGEGNALIALTGASFGVGKTATNENTIFVSTSTNKDIIFAGWSGATNTERMRITSAGAVLIQNKLTVGGVATINQVTKILQGSDTNDFASVAAGTESAVRTVTITGAVEGDPVFMGPVNAAGSPNIGWTAWVSAANTVSYKFYNRNTVAAVDLGNLTYKFFVHQL